MKIQNMYIQSPVRSHFLQEMRSRSQSMSPTRRIPSPQRRLASPQRNTQTGCQPNIRSVRSALLSNYAQLIDKEDVHHSLFMGYILMKVLFLYSNLIKLQQTAPAQLDV